VCIQRIGHIFIDALYKSTFYLITYLLTYLLGLFVDYFLNLIETSYRNLDEMFIRTYGLLYEQNADIFIDLFTHLRFDYHVDAALERRQRHRGSTDTSAAENSGDVRRTLDRFFIVLMRRMLTLLSQHSAPPTDQFLYCVSSRIDELRPFGDVPNKLSLQLHRAFNAARAFVGALQTGSDVIATLSKVPERNDLSRLFFQGVVA